MTAVADVQVAAQRHLPNRQTETALGRSACVAGLVLAAPASLRRY